MGEKKIIGTITQGQRIIGNISDGNGLSGNIEKAEIEKVPEYTGSYTVTPSDHAQTLNTRGLKMAENITVDPIPSNYGLITYNGNVLTVS